MDGLFYPLATGRQQRLSFLWQFIDIKVMILKTESSDIFFIPIASPPEQQYHLVLSVALRDLSRCPFPISS